MNRFNDVLIAIPSKARYNRILNYTAGWLLNSSFNWKVFAEPHEAVLYRRVIPSCHLVIIPKSDQGMHFVLNCIGRYAYNNNYKYILKIDDDCKGFETFPDNGLVQNLVNILDDIIPDFEADPLLGGVRFIQKRFWLYRKHDPKKYTHRNKPLWGISIYRAAAYPQLPSGVNHFDDTIHSLMMWQNGWSTLTYGKAGVDVLQNSGKGGHYSFDRRAMATAAIQYMIDHGFPLCKFKQNTNAGIGVDIDISAYDKGSCI